MAKKILIIQLRQLGDVILTTPLTRQVRKLYPHAEIHFLTETLGSHVYQYNTNINKLIIIKNKMNFTELLKTYYKINREKYDVVIDCFCNPKSAQFTFFSRAKERIGFNFSSRKFAYNKRIQSHEDNEYSAITKLRLISHLGSNLDDYEIEFPITNTLKTYANNFFNQYKIEKKIIAFHVVSRRDYKIWNANEFISLANILIEKGYFLFFTYGHNEYDMALQVYNGVQKKESALINYPIPNIPELRALLEHCSLYVGNDGGIKHLAVCANIPTLTIFQNINWTNWTPPNTNKHVAITNCLQIENFCKNCIKKSHCYNKLKAGDVVALLLPL
ncbi:MAG: glycosyltransferase family 9 protein [Bdellovibrionota bacterium]